MPTASREARDALPSDGDARPPAMSAADLPRDGALAPAEAVLLGGLVRPLADRPRVRRSSGRSRRRAASSSRPGSAWIQSLVREQPVPVGIVLFTVFEMALWAARHQLPLATHAHPPLRADLPPRLRGAVRAGARAARRGGDDPRPAREGRRPRAVGEGARAAARRARRAARRRWTRRPSTRTRSSSPRARRRRGRRAPRTLAQERGARVPRVDPRRRRRRVRAPRVRRRGVQDPERVDDPDAAGRRPHLRQQVQLRPGDPVHARARVDDDAAPTAATSWSSRSPSTRSRTSSSASSRIPGDKLEARNGHPIINGWEVPSCRVGP